MSEGSQSKKDRLKNSLTSNTEKQFANNEEVTSNAADPSSSSLPRASTPRAGALLVEAYARVVGRNPTFAPDKVVFDYIKDLVSILIFYPEFFIF
jgi:hypothetical protein